MATLNHPRKAVTRDGLLLSLGRVALEETKVRANANRHWAGDRRRAVPEPEGQTVISGYPRAPLTRHRKRIDDRDPLLGLTTPSGDHRGGGKVETASDHVG
jgi:hypothetical protein